MVHMRHILLLLALSSIFAALPARAFEIAVSPSRFEIDVNEGRQTHAIEILNTSDREVTVNVEIENFDLDEANKVRVVPPTEQSLDQWIVINPLTLNLPPDSRRTLRFAIRPQVRPEPGEHRAVIFLNEGDSRVVRGGARVRFRIGVVVYAQVGPYDRSAILHDVTPEARSVLLDIETIGNAHARFRGGYAVWSEATYPGDDLAQSATQQALERRTGREPLRVEGASLSGLLIETPVLPQNRRRVRQPVDLAAVPGPKRLFLFGTLGDTPVARSFILP